MDEELTIVMDKFAKYNLLEENEERETFDLSCCGLNSIPTSLVVSDSSQFERLKRLDLCHNFLEDLPENFPASFANLETLRLSGNDMTGLPETFSRLTFLNELFLDGNRMTELPECVCKLASLKRLVLSSNPLPSLPEEFGLYLEELEVLDLSGTALAYLPAAVGSLRSLKTLNLRNCKISVLPNSFGSLCNLTELDLSGNCLTVLPDSFGHLARLVSIDLSRNRLEKLTDILDCQSVLEHLNVSYNCLEGLPSWSCALPALTELQLYGNILCDGMPDLSASVHLDMLSIACVRVSRPMYDLRTLTKLRLGSGSEENWNAPWDDDLPSPPPIELPDAVCGITNLEALHAPDCGIYRLPDSFELRHLALIDLSYNFLRHIPDSLCNLPALVNFKLTGNRLKELPHLFGHLARLEVLHLDENKLQSLPTSMAELQSLSTLLLGTNRLSSYPPCLNEMQSITLLTLHENPFFGNWVERVQCQDGDMDQAGHANSANVISGVSNHIMDALAASNDVACLFCEPAPANSSPVSGNCAENWDDELSPEQYHGVAVRTYAQTESDCGVFAATYHRPSAEDMHPDDVYWEPCQSQDGSQSASSEYTAALHSAQAMSAVRPTMGPTHKQYVGGMSAWSSYAVAYEDHPDDF